MKIVFCIWRTAKDLHKINSWAFVEYRLNHKHILDITSEKMNIKHLQASCLAATESRAKKTDYKWIDKPIVDVGALLIGQSVLIPIAQCHAKEKHSVKKVLISENFVFLILLFKFCLKSWFDTSIKKKKIIFVHGGLVVGCRPLSLLNSTTVHCSVFRGFWPTPDFMCSTLKTLKAFL